MTKTKFTFDKFIAEAITAVIVTAKITILFEDDVAVKNAS